jgi:hypothetical protein
LSNETRCPLLPHSVNVAYYVIGFVRGYPFQLGIGVYSFNHIILYTCNAPISSRITALSKSDYYQLIHYVFASNNHGSNNRLCRQYLVQEQRRNRRSKYASIRKPRLITNDIPSLSDRFSALSDKKRQDSSTIWKRGLKSIWRIMPRT